MTQKTRSLFKKEMNERFKTKRFVLVNDSVALNYDPSVSYVAIVKNNEKGHKWIKDFRNNAWQGSTVRLRGRRRNRTPYEEKNMQVSVCDSDYIAVYYKDVEYTLLNKIHNSKNKKR